MVSLWAGPSIGKTATETAVDQLFSGKAIGETRAIVVLQDGKPVIERYAPGYGPDNRFISWSMAKSVTSTLLGTLVAAGKLDLNAPAPVPAWHRDPADPRGKIKLIDLVYMSSGLAHSETGPPVEGADTNRALFSDESNDAAAAAEAAQLKYAPGTRFEYSTLTTVILDDIIVRTIAPGATTPAARRAAMQAFLHDALIVPSAMASLVCEYDAAGTMLGGSFCHATARDWAKFGQMYLDNGVVGGKRVVAASWVAFVRRQSPTNPAYGGQFWLNHPGNAEGHPALFPDQGPDDLYSAIGHLGQYVMVAPSKHLVVVRLGKTPDGERSGLLPALGALVNSFPDAK
ncbi:serine hydrolase domain-containing protein [Glacieibacterium megasporae]|uniref:serine hydrolase domain-containing protein n=1 Tax=Glacieibacterium megasporae TaxID=2835787 RepID=UPI001C1DD4FA|nr:serine hydrolase [Polymorphobacter megasporae]UAJ11636.1 beta-lactamase family protein [Polymorphobacter megasporae]